MIVRMTPMPAVHFVRVYHDGHATPDQAIFFFDFLIKQEPSPKLDQYMSKVNSKDSSSREEPDPPQPLTMVKYDVNRYVTAKHQQYSCQLSKQTDSNVFAEEGWFRAPILPDELLWQWWTIDWPPLWCVIDPIELLAIEENERATTTPTSPSTPPNRKWSPNNANSSSTTRTPLIFPLYRLHLVEKMVLFHFGLVHLASSTMMVFSAVVNRPFDFWPVDLLLYPGSFWGCVLWAMVCASVTGSMMIALEYLYRWTVRR